MNNYYIMVCSEKTGKKYILDGRGSDYNSCHDWISRHKRKGFVYGVYDKPALIDLNLHVKFFKDFF